MIQGGSAGIAGVGATAPVYAPNVNTRSANTVVVTPDGQPVAIGGLIGNNKASSETKIPLLGDIPILGNLFKFSSHANVKNELLIFLTPHIIQMPSELAAMSAHETSQATLITNNVPEKELDRFLDRLPVKKQQAKLGLQFQQTRLIEQRMQPGRNSSLIYGLLLGVWLLVVAWQVEEHVRVRETAENALRRRSEAIANTIGAVVRGQQFCGAVFAQRLQPVLDELVTSDTNGTSRRGDFHRDVKRCRRSQWLPPAGRLIWNNRTFSRPASIGDCGA